MSAIDWANLPVHPAAEIFPMMSDAEIDELAQDIKANGLQVPIVVAYTDESCTSTVVIDGRNRLKACQLAGVSPVTELFSPAFKDDLVPLILSLNVHRRHLTSEQKRTILAASIKAEPELSDRQHAKRAKASDKTAGAVRRELESTAEIPQLDKRVGGDGRTRSKASLAERIASGELTPQPRNTAADKARRAAELERGKAENEPLPEGHPPTKRHPRSKTQVRALDASRTSLVGMAAGLSAAFAGEFDKTCTPELAAAAATEMRTCLEVIGDVVGRLEEYGRQAR
ncbi:ParB N-terminal domain-containing protein [Mycobacterium sp. 21AC1]|uniref:ParB N-terminal domain-containing protein n=1 Tax=[Mycobacterium] appelbergii TaxID=2939269 RepID=UPI0029391F73|nr:ParB N-terminal domain-containing protein [Mycobacterium sp. 21AC1]MDV3129099.1 ParB N-terminal domain-containing protein [Mycobacterium sp. 21AC1]